MIAGVLITVALFYNAGKNADNRTTNQPSASAGEQESPLAKMKPVSEKDHLFGNPDAPVKVVEFSDLECPFCKDFHATMHRVVNAYGDRVAWVYRQFPIPQLHPKAPLEAQAAECADKLGGNEKFWSFMDRIFEVTPSNNGLAVEELPKIAGEIGLDVKQFNSCLSSNYGQDRIQDDMLDAVNAGARGTPYSVVVNESGERFVINGALSFEQVSAIINQALK
jgi:protein-disulfide isomerase